MKEGHRGLARVRLFGGTHLKDFPLSVTVAKTQNWKCEFRLYSWYKPRDKQKIQQLS